MSQIDLELSSILSKLSVAEHSVENLQNVLPSSRILLAYDCDEARQIINAITESWLDCFTIENVESLLLNDLLHVIRIKVSQVFEKVETLTKDGNCESANEDSVEGKLLENLKLLIAVENILEYLSKYDQISAAFVPITLSSVNSVLLSGLTHFKNSETFYTNAVASILEVLSALLQKLNKIVVSFSALLVEKICFTCENEDELLLLIETLDSAGMIAEIIMTNFDLKLMAVQWKFFFKLIQTHIEFLSSRFDVSRAISFLIQQIVFKLDCVISKEICESLEVTKILKSCNFSVKLIVNLCELFTGNPKSCYKNIVDLLLCILGYSSPYLNLINMPSNVISEVERLLTVFSDPLLNLVINDSQFIQEFYSVSQEIQSMETNRKVGFFLLTLTILKKLLSFSDQNCTESNWIRSEVNIVDVIFLLMKHSYSVLFLELKLPGELYGDPSASSVYLYRSVMITLSAFVVGVISEADFSRIESTLLKNVCQQEPWPALLASDVWCALSRYASAELCFEQVKYFSNLVLTWSNDKKFEPEWLYVSCLTSRLFSFLSQSQKEQIKEQYPLSQENLKVWSSLRIPIPEADLKKTELLVRGVVLEFLFSEKSNKLMDLIAALEISSAINFEATPSEGEHFLELTNQLWNCLSDVDQFLSSEETTCREEHWLYQFVIALSNVTIHILEKVDNNQLLNIFSKLTYLCEKGCSLPKLCALNILTAVSDKVLDEQSNKKKVIEMIVKLFQLLLSDSNLIVRQVALETFGYFSTSTKYGIVIPLTIGNDQNLKITFSNYLNHVPHPLKQSIDLELFFEKQSEIRFISKRSSEANSVVDIVNTSQENSYEIPVMAPTKKIKLDSESTVNMYIKAVETNISALLPYIVSDNQINLEQKRKLSSAVESIRTALGINL